MTPEEERALEPGITPGPWEWRAHEYTPYNVEGSDRDYESLGTADSHALHTHDAEDYASWFVGSDEDKALIAVAPDMRSTIAACRIEYGVEVRPDEHSEWQHVGPWWDTPEQARAWRGRATIRIGQSYPHDRIVRRMVGPVEVVE